MIYYLISILILIVLIFILLFEFKIEIIVDNYDLKLKIFKKEVLSQNILQASKETFEVAYDSYLNNLIDFEDIKYLKIIRKFKFKVNEVKICGLQENFSVWSIVYGNLSWILNSIDYFLLKQKIPFTYNLLFYGKQQLYFHSIFKVSLGTIILEYFKIRRK